MEFLSLYSLYFLNENSFLWLHSRKGISYLLMFCVLLVKLNIVFVKSHKKWLSTIQQPEKENQKDINLEPLTEEFSQLPHSWTWGRASETIQLSLFLEISNSSVYS